MKDVQRNGENSLESVPKRNVLAYPHGGAIAGIIFGIIILVFGFAWLTGVDIWANIGPFMAILVGLLIVADAIYGVTRRR